MGKCNTEQVLSMIGVNKLTKAQELFFSVLQDNDSCVKIKTSDYLEIIGDKSAFNKYLRPEDAFNCLAEGCRNTGGLLITGNEFPLGATFKKVTDATDFYAGATTFYLDLPKDGTYTIEFKIAAINDNSFVNADVYRKKFTGTKGYNPIFIDFSVVPEEVLGEGWQANERGVYVSITVTTEEEIPLKQIHISSISFYNSIEELQNDEVVTIGCITEYGGDMTMDVADSVCFGAKYDPSSASITRTFTGGKTSGNYWLLNPFMRRGDLSKGWTVVKEKDKVRELTIDGRRYGYILLNGLSKQECSFSKALVASECSFTDAELTKVNLPDVAVLNEKQYQIIKHGEYDGYLIVHERLIGQPLLYAYPKEVSIEQYVGEDDAYEGRRVRLFFPTVQTDGVKVNYIFNNVLVTSFPTTLSNTDETTFEFEVSIQKDNNGRFFEVQKIIE
ncbi:hypothetical protein HRG58_06240 [Enterococcus faecalis]|nr:hypothetical protein [Enterococcus faecalis]